MASSSIWLICLLGLLLGHDFTGAEASAASQPYRTAFHFQPPKNWMNDPNGPMIYKGIYHLFYQYNPDGAIWGNIQWAHSTSTDLINWTPHPIAIYPSIPSDINGCWSGSATMLSDGKLSSNTILPTDGPIILYTGINPEQQQVQNLAMPKNLSDPYLVEWTKITENPLMAPNSENMIISSSFRDPSTAWYNNGNWNVIVGSKIGEVGKTILFQSEDFITWKEADHPLHSAGDGMWECPDFFPVWIDSDNGSDTSQTGEKLKHVLKVSLNDYNHDIYTIGTYDHVNDIYIPDNGSVESDMGLKYDYGKWYASKTFYDSEKNRRVLWGWINESTNATTYTTMMGWSGVQAIPRKIWLHQSGKQLIQWPVTELETLRTNKVHVPQTVLDGGSKLEIPCDTAIQADVEIEFEVANLDKADMLDPISMITDPALVCTQNGASVRGAFGPFGLLVFASKSLEEYTAVYFRIFKYEEKFVVLMCNDPSRSSLYLGYDKSSFGAFVDIDPTNETISLRTLVDHSIVESFGGGGKACITSRVYPTLTLTKGAYMYAFNNGTESVKISNLTAWSMKEPLTTSVAQEVSFAQPRSWNECLALWVSIVSMLYALMNL